MNTLDQIIAIRLYHPVKVPERSADKKQMMLQIALPFCTSFTNNQFEWIYTTIDCLKVQLNLDFIKYCNSRHIEEEAAHQRLVTYIQNCTTHHPNLKWYKRQAKDKLLHKFDSCYVIASENGGRLVFFRNDGTDILQLVRIFIEGEHEEYSRFLSMMANKFASFTPEYHNYINYAKTIQE